MTSPIDNSWPNPPCANINDLEKRKFQEDGSGNVCVNVCMPDEPGAGAYNLIEIYGTNAGSTSPVNVIELNLALSTEYSQPDITISCFRESVWRLKVDDDGTVATKAVLRLGSGQYSFSKAFKHIKFTTGGVGTQKLILEAENLNKASCLDATVTIREKI